MRRFCRLDVAGDTQQLINETVFFGLTEPPRVTYQAGSSLRSAENALG